MSDTPRTQTLSLHRDAFGRLCVTLPDGSTRVGVLPVRCFPFTAAGRDISLTDPAGREVACVASPDHLDPDSRAVLLEELARRELIPDIRRILSISQTSPKTTWEVDTDRGQSRFVIPGEDSVRQLDSESVVITDETGLRYRVPSLRKLDGRSRKLLRRYL
jgi:hypothetical protein